MGDYPEDVWDFLMYYAQKNEQGELVVNIQIVREALEHYFYN